MSVVLLQLSVGVKQKMFCLCFTVVLNCFREMGKSNQKANMPHSTEICFCRKILKLDYMQQKKKKIIQAL